MTSIFTDASSDPDDNLVREVYAHYGLCMYLAQVFETGLVNTLTALETADSEKSTRQTFDELYARHESLTFGNLMKNLLRHNFLPADLLSDVRNLKAERDQLAHRFFRDHALNFVTTAGCHTMIERLKILELRFDELDKRVFQFQVQAYSRIGFDTDRLKDAADEIRATMMDEARARYSSGLPQEETQVAIGDSTPTLKSWLDWHLNGRQPPVHVRVRAKQLDGQATKTAWAINLLTDTDYGGEVQGLDAHPYPELDGLGDSTDANRSDAHGVVWTAKMQSLDRANQQTALV